MGHLRRENRLTKHLRARGWIFPRDFDRDFALAPRVVRANRDAAPSRPQWLTDDVTTIERAPQLPK
jgi:hypothetical protein